MRDFFVTPSGFEPKSSEPESEILSIELWSLFGILDYWISDCRTLRISLTV